eukprot:scaffold73845_cov36-Tisochrysis_lutea.AAC.1
MGEPHIHIHIPYLRQSAKRTHNRRRTIYLYTPLKWGRAYDGPAETAYPRRQEYTFKGSRQPMDRWRISASIKALTQEFLAMRKTKRQKTTIRWENVAFANRY